MLQHPQTLLHAAFALFGLFMLVRNAPRARAAFRAGERGGAVISLVNVLLAVVILVVAVKGLAGALISR